MSEHNWYCCWEIGAADPAVAKDVSKFEVRPFANLTYELPLVCQKQKYKPQLSPSVENLYWKGWKVHVSEL